LGGCPWLKQVDASCYVLHVLVSAFWLFYAKDRMYMHVGGVWA